MSRLIFVPSKTALEHPNKHSVYWSLDMQKFLKKFVKDESGATAIEYGLIAAGIAVVIIVAVQLAGTNLNDTWNTIADAV